MENNDTKLVTKGLPLLNSGLVHRIKTPSTPGPHPTVIMLHGRFGNEDVMWVFAHTLPPDWLVVAPRATVPEQGGYSWHPQRDEWPTLSDFDEAVTAVSHFIQSLPEQYNADPKQIYLMGFSQGAAAAVATALYYPKLVRGIAGLVGFVPDDAEHLFAEAPLKNVPVLLLIGKHDRFIPVEMARKSGKAIRAAGGRLDYQEYDTGHKLNGAGMRKLKTWWAEQAQDSHKT